MERTTGHRLRTESVGLAQHDRAERHREVGAGHEQPGAMTDQRGLLDLGSHHHAGRVAQEQDRDIEGIAKLQEARRLVRAVRVDGAREVRRVVGNNAERLALDAGEGRHHARAEGTTQFEHRALVAQRRNHVAHVVDPQPVLGDRAAQQPLVGRLPLGQGSLEKRKILLGDRDRLGLVLDGDIDLAVGDLHAHRAHFLG